MPGDTFWRFVLRPIVGPLVKLVLRVRSEGAHHVPRTGPVLLVSNHGSWWDIPTLGAAQPRTVRFMAKSELFRNPAVRTIFVWGGTFPVRRGQPDREALRTVHETVAGGGVVGLFLQGHRRADLEEAKAGAGRIAIVEACPVVPVAIRGTRGWRPGGTVTVRFGPPRHYTRGDRRPGEAYRATADEILEEIRRLYERG